MMMMMIMMMSIIYVHMSMRRFEHVYEKQQAQGREGGAISSKEEGKEG
jgi:hypothetical protein